MKHFADLNLILGELAREGRIRITGELISISIAYKIILVMS